MYFSLVLPTRGRPNNMQNLYNSIIESISDNNDFEIIFYIDDDDDVSLKKINEMKNYGLKVDYCKGPRQTLSNCWNEAYKKSSGEIIGFIDDETRFITKEWDKIIIKEFNKYPDRICFVGGNDNYYNIKKAKNFCTIGFLHKNWIQNTGYFVPPYFVADYCDTWLNDVAKLIGRHCWIEELQIHHLHRLTEYGTDSTHIQRLNRASVHKPELLYYSEAMKREREKDAIKLQSFINNFKKVKQ